MTLSPLLISIATFIASGGVQFDVNSCWLWPLVRNGKLVQNLLTIKVKVSAYDLSFGVDVHSADRN